MCTTTGALVCWEGKKATAGQSRLSRLHRCLSSPYEPSGDRNPACASQDWEEMFIQDDAEGTVADEKTLGVNETVLDYHRRPEAKKAETSGPGSGLAKK